MADGAHGKSVLGSDPRLLLSSRADSTGRCNSLREYIRRRAIAQCLARPGVELAGNRIQLRLGVAGEVGPLRQILAQQTIRVLVGAALPRLYGSQK